MKESISLTMKNIKSIAYLVAIVLAVIAVVLYFAQPEDSTENSLEKINEEIEDIASSGGGYEYENGRRVIKPGN